MALDDLRGVHVLVVDDTDDSRELLRAALENCGAFVTTAASAEQAKRLLRQVLPHVLVGDIDQLDDGPELIREVKAVAVKSGTRLPVIAVTDGSERRRELPVDAVAELVPKPIDPLELCTLVRRHVESPK
jgi:CheY-like chemotaxis protein